MVDEWNIYYKAAWSTLLVKYTTMEFADENSYSAKISEWKKSVQLAHLVNQFDVRIVLEMVLKCVHLLVSGCNCDNPEELTIQDELLHPDYTRQDPGQ
jgi:hypothetical protein